MNLASYLERHAAATPERASIRFEGATITYADLNRRASQLADALSRGGIHAGDRVALYLPNVPEFVVAYYAVQKIGALVLTINAILKTEEVRYLLDDAEAAAIIATGELVSFVPDCQSLRLRIATDGDGALGWQTLAAFTAGAKDDLPGIERQADDEAALMYSSGTTGFPKGIVLTQANIHSNIAHSARYSDYQAGDRILVFLPLFHVYGQNYLMNATILAGATIVLFRRFVPDVVLKAIGDEKVTHFFAVPTIYINLLAADLSAFDLSSIRYEMSAAATMPEEISRRWTEKFGRRVYEGYGLTECSPLACYNDAEAHRFGSVGRAIAGTEVAIFDDFDKEVPRGTQGEIVIRGEGVMKGYWRRPADSAKTLRNGWLHTGDVGRMDEDGYVFIMDRVKDMINVSGFKVWPAELEQYLYKLFPGIQEAAAFGIPDGAKGEKVGVSVVLKPGVTLTEEQLINTCKENIAAYKVPSYIEFINELPKSPSGKILKRVLRSQHGGD